MKRKRLGTAAAPVKRETAEKKPRARAQKTVVREIRQKVEEKLTSGVEKATLADYIRLIQLEKELTVTGPKETKATWVDPKDLEAVPEAAEGEAGAEAGEFKSEK